MSGDQRPICQKCKKRKSVMELIILDDGIYSLVKVTKEMMKQIELFSKVDCFDLCDIIRLKLTTFNEFANRHVMNDGSGDFYGCICR